jgi:hypothetical protein
LIVPPVQIIIGVCIADIVTRLHIGVAVWEVEVLARKPLRAVGPLWGRAKVIALLSGRLCDGHLIDDPYGLL